MMLAGTLPAAARTLRAALKEAAGKLLAQLYDRNCRRHFLPLEAFQTDSLPPERFQMEMQTAAAAAGGLMQATNTRVWGLLRSLPMPACTTSFSLHLSRLLPRACASYLVLNSSPCQGVNYYLACKQAGNSCRGCCVPLKLKVTRLLKCKGMLHGICSSLCGLMGQLCT